MYSPNMGFVARTRLEMVKQAYEKWIQLSGSKDTLTEFQGTNVHLLCNVFFSQIEVLESQIAHLQAAQFTYWENHQLGIHSSFGASYEGWQAVFGPLCDGLDIIGHMEDPTIRPGEIAIYFDNLEATQEQIRDAFVKCKNVAEPTIRGDNMVQIQYSNGQMRDYCYNNLAPENYTPIQVRIHVEYQRRALEYKESDFVQHFEENFKKLNRINTPFYPEAYMDVTQFPGVADITIMTKLEEDDTFVEGVRPIAMGHKFRLEGVMVP